MRNKFLLIITASLLWFCPKTHAQLATPPGPDLQEKAAGYELVKASRHFYTGTIILGGGIVLDGIGAVEALSSSNANAGGGLELLGSLAVITGFVFMIESYSHIGRAGKILMQRNDLTFGPTRNGMGLSIHF